MCTFWKKDIENWCVKGAYTEIAAFLINEKTLHVLAGIPVREKKTISSNIEETSRVLA
jgi:hypothetical protein